MFHDVARPLEIKVYDRHEMDYTGRMVAVEPFCDDNDLFSVEENADTLIRRRDFLLGLLIGNENHAEMYNKEVNNFPDHLQLILAITICWMDKATPNKAMQRALAITLVVLPLIEENPDLRDRPVVAYLLDNKRDRVEVNTQLLRWISEWEILLKEALDLNKLLESPLPKPNIGKIMSAAVLENIFNRKRIEEELMKIELFSDRYQIITALLFQ